MRERARQTGFTLLEVLLASAIFAIVAGIAATGLQSASRSYSAIEAQRIARNALERALSLLESDLLQVSARPVREDYGQNAAALQGRSSELALSTQTVRISDTGPRADSQRVRYQMTNAGLRRSVRVALDAAPNTPERSELLLSDVRSLNFSYVDFSNQRSPIWPPANARYELDALPRAIEVRLRDARFGEITRLVLVSDVAPRIADSPDPQPAP